jgi:hypothetical protein
MSPCLKPNNTISNVNMNPWEAQKKKCDVMVKVFKGRKTMVRKSGRCEEAAERLATIFFADL